MKTLHFRRPITSHRGYILKFYFPQQQQCEFSVFTAIYFTNSFASFILGDGKKVKRPKLQNIIKSHQKG